MESRKIVFTEVAFVAIGEVIGVAAMLGVYALLGYFSMPVLWGGIVGGLMAVLNFFAMAVVVSLAADRAEKQDVQGAQKMIKGSYPLRLLLLAVVLFAFAKSGICDVLALALPLIFVRPTLTIAEFFRKKGV